MTGTPWIKFYAGDFLNGVADLSPNEIAVYTIILMRLYDEDRPVPNDPTKIARRCNMRLPQCKDAICSLIEAGKIIVAGEFLDNNRARSEREKRTQTSSKQRDNVAKRWSNEAEKPNETKETPIPPHEVGIADSIPTRSQKPETRKKEEESFAVFYNLYPRKQDRGHAVKAWRTACKKAPPETVIAGLKRYPFSHERKYIPLPATWLNGERWADQTTPESGNGILPAGVKVDGEGRWCNKFSGHLLTRTEISEAQAKAEVG